MNQLRGPLAFIVGVTALKLALAAMLGLLADEAYYWVWSLHPAFGYYDQPPLIAWIVGLGSVFGPSEIGVRIGAVLCGVVLAVAPLRLARDPWVWVTAWACPVLAGLTLFATPDAPLLATWAVAVVAAIHGERAWLLAGVAAGLAFLSKHSGAAVLPLLVLFAGPSDWKSPWPWAAFLPALLIAAPNLAWNAAHGWVTVVFQLHEGLLNEHMPGPAGPMQMTFAQMGVVTPILGLAGLYWAFTAPLRDRTTRLLWAASVPLLAFFLVAAWFGPPEAHWPAPAWIGIALGLSRSDGRLLRAAGMGAWLGALITGVLAIHAVHPILDLPDDPGVRLTEGPLIAETVAEWALPAGTPLHSRISTGATPVVTERYQEAAFIHFYAGIPARRLPGCGRADQYDLWDAGPLPDDAILVRPSRFGPTLCSDPQYPDRDGPHRFLPVDRFGRVAGRWDVFEIRR